MRKIEQAAQDDTHGDEKGFDHRASRAGSNTPIARPPSFSAGQVFMGLILLSAAWAVVLAHREFANVVATSS